MYHLPTVGFNSVSRPAIKFFLFKQCAIFSAGRIKRYQLFDQCLSWHSLFVDWRLRTCPRISYTWKARLISLVSTFKHLSQIKYLTVTSYKQIKVSCSIENTEDYLIRQQLLCCCELKSHLLSVFFLYFQLFKVLFILGLFAWVNSDFYST